MKLLLGSLALAALAIGASLFIQGGYGQFGNVVFLMAPWRVDVSLNLFLLLFLASAFAIWLLAYLAVRLSDFPGQVRAYQARREQAGSQRALREAIRALLEGRFARAQREAQQAMVHAESRGIACLLAARAAHRMQAYEQRDAWLQQAAQDSSMRVARLVAEAEMCTEARQYQRASEALASLHATGSRHVHAARVALSAHAQAGRWQDVLRGVRVLTKRGALHPSLAERLQVRAYRGLLEQRQHDPIALVAQWNQFPVNERRAPQLALEAARFLGAAGRAQAAADAIEVALGARWECEQRAALLAEYARVDATPIRLRIEQAERWLESHPEDADLLRCLGLLCFREQLWGKAQTYLSCSLKASAHPQTRLALARLAETVGDELQATEHYRAAALDFERFYGEATRQRAQADLQVHVSI